MSVESTLAKTAADLRDGRVEVARRRLRGLLSSFPADLAVRHALAAAYSYPDPDSRKPPFRSRWHCHFEEAGRWNFLDESLTAYELMAFEWRFRDPARRLAMLRWPDPAHNPPPTAVARRRLAGLYREATGASPSWPEHPDDAATVASPLPVRRMAALPRRPARDRPPLTPSEHREPEIPLRVAAFRLGLFVAVGVALIALAFR
ncbi:DUF6584 family protein [Streptomyces sp. TLI_171]|uniref:DUF6584 family protein n=1 Tax=Streptomyces sp. TLI_171 TaxID=1938859 RepID=UPI000C19C5A5|nr:DUF6584 family protein [Streptomyces sp. TLI_171]RKE21714.1 hypothetical protein BX266_5113 [Streptomyces sp. TLI_171]